jgi:protocatechuate 3,4-dioxygenase beta subunit
MMSFKLFRPTRRAALAAFASTPAVIASATRASAQAAPGPAVSVMPACILTPASIPGPFYFDPKLERADITEGHPGAPLRMRFMVMDAATCVPIPRARVDVWHTRADGFYSGYPGQGDNRKADSTGGTFMRGTQFSDARGEAEFRSVYPGWYGGRTAHVHFKIFIDDRNMLTGQMYFPDALSQYIYANVGTYRRKLLRDTFNGSDEFALLDTTRGGFCDIKEEVDHYRATLIVGVSRTTATVMNEKPTPPIQPRAIVPGVAASKQNNG